MDILKREEKNCRCKKHPAHEIQFINTNITEDQGINSLYYCDMCIGEDFNLQNKNIIPIAQIIKYSENSIILKWPPVNNYQILKDLSEITSQNQNKDAVCSRITNHFSKLKEQIVEQIDLIQKKIVNKVEDSFKEIDKVLEKYQQISQINQLRNILIGNLSNNLGIKTKDLLELISQLTTQKTQNTDLLKQLLDHHKSHCSFLNGEYETQLKDSLLSYMKSLSSFVNTENMQQNNKNEQSHLNLKIQDLLNQEVKKGELIKSDQKSLSSLSTISTISGSQQDKQRNVIKNMIQSTYANSKDIDVIRNENEIIQLIPRKIILGQLYSEQKIDQNQIYEFILRIKQKPTNYICVGFEEEQFKNRYLGQSGKNSFILGQKNAFFCSKLVKGEKNLQALCEEEFVETLVIQVLLSQNKFYIADYPQKRAVNCMDEASYSFKKDRDYFFTVLIMSQNTQVDIIQSHIIGAFTII